MSYPGSEFNNLSESEGKMRRIPTMRLAGVAAATALTLLAAACSGSSQQGSAVSGGKAPIVVAVPDQVTSVVEDAGTISTTDGNEVALSMNAGLVQPAYIPAGEPGVLKQDPYRMTGVLAQSYEVSSDGLVYTFHLRQGVLSDHRNPLTAQDVLWSFERKASSPDSGFSQFAPMLTDPAKQITVVNPLTVSFTLAKVGYGFSFLSVLAENIGAIYDAAYLKPHATPSDPYAIKWTTQSWDNVNFGFGPYELESYTPGQGEVLVSNPHYALGAPKITKITRRVVADSGTRASLLRNGDVDVAEGLSPADLASLAGDSHILVPRQATNNLLFVSLGAKIKPFNNEAVRQAFAYAIPYQQIISNVYQGRADRQGSFLDPSAPNYSASFPLYTYDPSKAKQMLTAAGYPHGVAFTLPVTSAIPDAAAAAIQIQNFAKAAGFTVNIKQEAEAPLFQSIFAGQVQASVISGRIYSLSPPIELSNFTATLNFSGWTDQQFLNVLQQGENAGDVLGSQAGQYWSRANSIVVQQAPYIVVAATGPVIAVRSGIKGYTVRSDGRLDYAEATG